MKTKKSQTISWFVTDFELNCCSVIFADFDTVAAPPPPLPPPLSAGGWTAFSPKF